jgi:hypothetical protein
MKAIRDADLASDVQGMLDHAQSDVQGMLDHAQTESILVTRVGKPSAMLVGIENFYDEEDFQLMRSPEFWQMIADRRRSGEMIPLAEVQARLGLDKSVKAKRKNAANGKQRKRRAAGSK